MNPGAAIQEQDFAFRLPLLRCGQRCLLSDPGFGLVPRRDHLRTSLYSPFSMRAPVTASPLRNSAGIGKIPRRGFQALVPQ
jgi:hypothetical protein